VLPYQERVLDAGKTFAADAHAAGAAVGTWIVDDPGTAVTLMRAGVDAVATNDPRSIVAARDAAFG
jgi:glycerophosphoryl diester phosphodiesterase